MPVSVTIDAKKNCNGERGYAQKKQDHQNFKKEVEEAQGRNSQAKIGFCHPIREKVAKAEAQKEETGTDDSQD
jgi:hypothetical protein